ncbi:RagB/SusD family nutrient uptake outer membrane protein [Bacteroides cellulosilyticus]|uniref:RagB/SusD family nutrient uptake outer membrane protein n=1 Tax=Bacteroides cellulosilyticus TaxID=246787 RepID=UPI0022E1552C|nr:RagB/SusD family nutrient uptake outer membrane protein [Bacteroides cellulosilyticus]
MKTRTVQLSIICVAVTMLLSACNDWLDVKSSSELDRKDLFKNETGYAEALTGVYSGMSGTSLYGRTLTFLVPDLLAGYAASGMPGGSIAEWQNYSYKHSDENRNASVIEVIDRIWLDMYNQIANLNAMLECIDQDRNLFSGDNYRILKGEAKGLRAFLHFELLRMFGEPYSIGRDNRCIPYVDELSTDIFPLLTVDEALIRVIEELKEARELLVNDPIHLGTEPSEVLAPLPSDTYNRWQEFVATYHNRRFCFNYYAAIATLARAYLWKGDKVNALACAKEIIADQEKRFPWVTTDNLTRIGMNDQYSYNQDRTFATEHIFALNIEKLEEYIDGYTYQGENSLDQYSMPVSYAGEFFYTGKDIRSQYLLTTIGYYKYSSKFYQSNVVLPCFQKRMPLIRLSEMYYIAAECEPDSADGLKWLDCVRSHRGLTDELFTGTEDVKNEVMSEYQKEFMGEGQLWFYYKRKVASSIPNAYSFSGDPALYTFDRPEDEDIYGGRVTGE